NIKLFQASNSGSNRTNNLLDAIPTTNAYLDSEAINVGYALQGTTVLEKCGNHWCRIGTTQVVNSSLTNNTATNVVSLIETYKYNNCSSWITQAKGLTKIANSCAVAGNGLAYDNCQGGTRNWSSASSYCSGKGMRLPALNETSYASGSGVPSCGSWTWTSPNGGNHYVWNGTSYSGYGNGDDSYSGYVRCVK
ncbi:hypothetical protein, partial [Aliarcobacter butzleri]|uniref:hypothetical protein n=1 Tax=Aliarcobacter butzleri TaxID=28197 RepID=UPI00186A670F